MTEVVGGLVPPVDDRGTLGETFQRGFVAQPRIRWAAVELTTYSETFALLAELALALAGFGGVAAAFGGRERSYRATERIRLRAVFTSSGMVLAGCLGVQTLLAVDQLASSAFVLVGAFSLVGQLTVGTSGLRGAYRHASDPDSTSERWALHLSAAYILTVLILYLWCVRVGEAWPLIAGSSIHLLFGLWMFTRILTRPN